MFYQVVYKDMITRWMHETDPSSQNIVDIVSPFLSYLMYYIRDCAKSVKNKYFVAICFFSDKPHHLLLDIMVRVRMKHVSQN